MTTRQQILRSSTPGQSPAAGTRLPGELWTTFPDLQLGVIDASKNAQRLIAIRFFSTSANYAAGDFIVQGGKLWFAKAAITAGAFNATQWTQIAALSDIPSAYTLPTASPTVLGGVKIDNSTVKIDGSGVISSGAGLYLPLAGGTLTGPLLLNADPGAALGAATKQYADNMLPLAGGTLTGSLILKADPGALLEAATKQYVDKMLPLAGGTLTGALNGTTASFSGVATAADPPTQDSSGKLVTTSWFGSHLPATKENSNRIINGDMRIDQRNNGASGTATGYTVDRWQFSAPQANKLSWQRWGVSGNPEGFQYATLISCTAAYSPLAGEAFQLRQPIEADAVGDLQWGTSLAQSATLSFWVNCSIVGTLGGSIFNSAANRSFPFSFSNPTANVWVKVVIPVPGDTGGTWVLSGNARSVLVCFDLGANAAQKGPAGAWAAALYTGASGSSNICAVNGAAFYVTGVKLEIGNVATPFNRQSLAKSLADCQRYYETGNAFTYSYNNAGWNIGYYAPFETTKRAVPTTVLVGLSSPANVSASSTLDNSFIDGFSAHRTVTTTNGAQFGDSFAASAEL